MYGPQRLSLNLKTLASHYSTTNILSYGILEAIFGLQVQHLYYSAENLPSPSFSFTEMEFSFHLNRRLG